MSTIITSANDAGVNESCFKMLPPVVFFFLEPDADQSINLQRGICRIPEVPGFKEGGTLTAGSPRHQARGSFVGRLLHLKVRGETL
jgi:hypothetical protein